MLTGVLVSLQTRTMKWLWFGSPMMESLTYVQLGTAVALVTAMP